MKVKTKDIIDNINLAPEVVRDVVDSIGEKSYLRDVAAHGADAGFPGFTYYSDTCTFYAKHQRAIVAFAQSFAEELGEDGALALVKGFRCLQDVATEEEIARTLYGPESEHDTQVANALAWFALEEVARVYSDLKSA